MSSIYVYVRHILGNCEANIKILRLLEVIMWLNINKARLHKAVRIKFYRSYSHSHLVSGLGGNKTSIAC
jgi:hypothetical protein